MWRQTFERWDFGFRRCLGTLFETPLGHGASNSDYDLKYFLKISFLFSKQGWCYVPDSFGDPQAEQSILVMVR